MSNVKQVRRKSININLGDGQDRELKITLNAMAELEERYGSVDAAFKALEGGSIKAVRCVLWAALLHDEDNALTEKQVGNMIDTNNINQIMETLGKAMDNDMPDANTDVVVTPVAVQNPN